MHRGAAGPAEQRPGRGPADHGQAHGPSPKRAGRHRPGDAVPALRRVDLDSPQPGDHRALTTSTPRCPAVVTVTVGYVRHVLDVLRSESHGGRERLGGVMSIAAHFDSYSTARAHFKELLDA